MWQISWPSPWKQHHLASIDSAAPARCSVRNNFAEFSARYEIDYAPRLGRFRLERISTAVGRFLDCGDYTQGCAVTD
jgi:hypothetical protein